MTAALVALHTGTVAPRRAPNVAAEVGSVYYLDYTPSTSYATSGDAIDIVAALPNQIRGIFAVTCIPTDSSAGWAAAYDATNKKILLWNGTTQATAADRSANKFLLRVDAY
jgi:hypothetical protein